MTGRIYVISGPSGSGKSTIIKLLRRSISGLGYSISHTSRRPRSNEINGIDYHFVGRDTFSRMIDDAAFVEWAEVYNDFYGTSLSGLSSRMEQGFDVVMDLESRGAKKIKEHFKKSILIFILPPSIMEIEKRLRERATEDEDAIDKRIKKAVEELKNCAWYDYILINDDLNKAVRQAESIIISERCRKSNMLPRFKDMLGII